jgi:Fe-S-cluster containining protein
VEDSVSNQVFRPLPGNSFRFRCYQEIACFTRCCAALRLQLTPYDILRMKNRLGIPSDEFLESYGETFFEDQSRFPLVRLRMREEPPNRCPFVSPSGCAIYEDRPGSCRIYPLGRATMKPGGSGGNTRERYFVVQEAHCLGFQEDREWSVEEWMGSEGMADYNAMNDLWLEVLTFPRSLGPEKDAQRRMQMFFMGSYNLDRFRRFVFEGPLLRRIRIEQERLERMAADEVSLLRFSFEWLKFSLFGEPSPYIKPA